MEAKKEISRQTLLTWKAREWNEWWGKRKDSPDAVGRCVFAQTTRLFSLPDSLIDREAREDDAERRMKQLQEKKKVQELLCMYFHSLQVSSLPSKNIHRQRSSWFPWFLLHDDPLLSSPTHYLHSTQAVAVTLSLLQTFKIIIIILIFGKEKRVQGINQVQQKADHREDQVQFRPDIVERYVI